MNCLIMLATVMGTTAAVLILIGAVKGIIDHSGRHDEE